MYKIYKQITKEAFIEQIKNELQPLSSKILTEEYQVFLARRIALYAHEGQVRNRGAEKDKPYFNHPSRVANKFSDWKYAAIGFLHDVLEDTEFTAADLLEMGVFRSIVDVVIDLTKTENETYFDFIMRIKDNPIANEIKLADIEDNMATLEEGSLKDKYRFAKYILDHD